MKTKVFQNQEGKEFSKMVTETIQPSLFCYES
jgi:hypothetical protein